MTAMVRITLNSVDKASMTITISDGLNAECWCILTFTSKQLLVPKSVLTTVFAPVYTVSQKNVLTLKRYSSKLQGAILMKFGRNIQNTLEEFVCFSFHVRLLVITLSSLKLHTKKT